MHEEPFPTIPLTIDEGLAGRLRVDAFLLEPVSPGTRAPSLEKALTELTNRYRALWKEPAEAHEACKPARKLYHSLGIDPSKTRPSSEALLRRILQGKGLYNVNAVVDAANLASLTLLLPVGLYDAGGIVPPVVLRLGLPGESYEGIRKDQVHLTGRPVLVDRTGPFGNPTSDSMRTSVTEATRAVWFVLFAPVDSPETKMREDLRIARNILREHASG